MFLSIKKRSSKSPGRHRRDRSCPGRLDGRSRSLASLKTKLFPTKSAGPASFDSANVPDLQASDGGEPSPITAVFDSEGATNGSGRMQWTANGSKSNGSNILDDFYGSSASISFGRAAIRQEVPDVSTFNSSHDSGYQNGISASTSSGTFSESSAFTDDSDGRMSWETVTTNTLNNPSSMTSFYHSRAGRASGASRTSRASRSSRNSKSSKSSFRDSSIFGFDNNLIFSNTLLYGPSSYSRTDLSADSSVETTSRDSMTTDSNTLESFYDSSTCPDYASSQEMGNAHSFGRPHRGRSASGNAIRDGGAFAESSSIEVEVIGAEEVRAQERTEDGSFHTAFSGNGDKTGSAEEMKTQGGQNINMSVDSIDRFSGSKSAKSGDSGSKGGCGGKGSASGTGSDGGEGGAPGGAGSVSASSSGKGDKSGGSDSSAGGKELGGSGSGSRSFRVGAPSDGGVVPTADRAREGEGRDRYKEVGFEVLALGKVRVTWYPSASADAAVLKVLGCGA